MFNKYVGWKWASDAVANGEYPCTFLIAAVFKDQLDIKISPVSMKSWKPQLFDQLLSGTADQIHPEMLNLDLVNDEEIEQYDLVVLEVMEDLSIHTGVILSDETGIRILHAVAKFGGVITPIEMLEAEGWVITDRYRHKKLK